MPFSRCRVDDASRGVFAASMWPDPLRATSHTHTPLENDNSATHVDVATCRPLLSRAYKALKVITSKCPLPRCTLKNKWRVGT